MLLKGNVPVAVNEIVLTCFVLNTSQSQSKFPSHSHFRIEIRPHVGERVFSLVGNVMSFLNCDD